MNVLIGVVYVLKEIKLTKNRALGYATRKRIGVI